MLENIYMICDLLLSWTELLENGLRFVKVGIKLKVELRGESLFQN